MNVPADFETALARCASRPFSGRGFRVVPASDVPAALGVAWEARMAEKKALMALSNELILNLRPELDRLTSELVQRTLEGLWAKRCEKYQNSGH